MIRDCSTALVILVAVLLHGAWIVGRTRLAGRP